MQTRSTPGVHSYLIGAPEPMSIEEVLAALQLGGFARSALVRPSH
jgi:hypothetical protein